MKVGKIRIPLVLSSVLLGLTMALATISAAQSLSWFQTGNYLRQDPYGTDFYAQGATWWDPVDSSNIYVWRTYLRMDVVDAQYLNCDMNWVQSSGFSEKRNWYNSPFPVNSGNSPVWDYFTWDRNHGFVYRSDFGASRDEQCNLTGSVPTGVWWSKASSSGGWGYGVR